MLVIQLLKITKGGVLVYLNVILEAVSLVFSDF